MRQPCSMLLLPALLLTGSSLCLAAEEAPAHYRCELNGKTVFQDFPCNQVRKQQGIRPAPAAATPAAPVINNGTPKVGSKESVQALNERLARERRRTDINYEILDLEASLAKLDKKRQADIAAEMDKPIVTRNPAFRAKLEEERTQELKRIAVQFATERQAIEDQINTLYGESNQLSALLKLPAVDKPATLVAADARAAAESKAKEAAEAKAKGK